MTCSFKNGWKVEFVRRACSVSRRCSSLQIGKRARAACRWVLQQHLQRVSKGSPLVLSNPKSTISILNKSYVFQMNPSFCQCEIMVVAFSQVRRGYIWVNAQFWSKETPLSMLIPVHSSSSSLCLSIWFPRFTNSCKVGSNSLYTNSYGQESNWPTICFVLLSFSLSRPYS